MSATTTTVPSDPAPLDRNIVHRCCALKVSGDRCRQFALRGQELLRRPRQPRTPRLRKARPHHYSPARGRRRRPAHRHQNPLRPRQRNHQARRRQRHEPHPQHRRPHPTSPRPPQARPLPTPAATCAPHRRRQRRLGRSSRALARRLRQHHHLRPARLGPRTTQSPPTPPPPSPTATSNSSTDLIRQKIRREKAESAAARAAGLPDPHPENAHYRSNGKCAFGIPFCDGPCDPEPCMFCRGDLHLQPTAPQYPGDNVLALVVALRTHISQQESNQQQEPRYPAQVSSSTKPIESLQVQPTHEAGRGPCTATCHRREGAPESGTETCQGTTFSRAARDPKKAGLQPLSTNTTDAPSPASEGPLDPEPLVLNSKQQPTHPARPLPTRRGTRNTDRQTVPNASASYRPQPAACSHVVKFVNEANHHIPNEQKLAQPRKRQISLTAEH